MLLPKFDILNKIKKERTITLANAIINTTHLTVTKAKHLS